MQLTITLRKEVYDKSEADLLVDIVKEKLVGQPDITVTAQISEKIEIVSPPDP